MAATTTYEDKVAEIEGMRTALEQMERLVEEMEEELARMPAEADGGGSGHYRELGLRAIEEAWGRISSKYDVVIAKEMELQEVDRCESPN